MDKLLKQTMWSVDVVTGSESELKDALRRCLGFTIQALRAAAEIVAELDRRESDLSEFNKTAINYLRRIASGQLLPELLIDWRDTPVYNKARFLPPLDQQRVVDNKPIRVVVLKDGGVVDAWLCEPKNMTPAIAKQVFATGHIRDDGEQLAWLRSQVASPQPAEPLPYSIKGSAVIFSRPCRLTRRDLKRLLDATKP